MNILVVGLGKLGLPLAVFLKSKGHEVWGYDVDRDRINSLQKGELEHWEPGCTPVGYAGITFSKEIDYCIDNTDIAFICVQTPIKGDGSMDTSFVKDACNAIGHHHKAFRRQVGEYPIVVASTVMPGTCRSIQDGLLDINVRIVSMPVWIAMGSVLKDLENPPGLVVGCDCPGVNGHCVHATQVTTIFHGPAIRTDTRTAEFIKLAHNAWCCTKMAWLGNIGDNAPALGIDINALSSFMQHGGERPGQFWKYGPSFGGPCFPRDLLFWLQAMGRHDSIGKLRDDIANQVNQVNQDRFMRLATKLVAYKDVCIVGEGYKKDVPVDEASVAKNLGQLLEESHLQQRVTFWPEGQETAQVFVRMHDDDTTAVPLPDDGRPIINTWRA